MDALNGNTVWYDATEKEVKLIQDDFEYICIGEESGITDDYQKIPLLWTFPSKFMDDTEKDYVLEDTEQEILRRTTM